jgi:hypothetical protein
MATTNQPFTLLQPGPPQGIAPPGVLQPGVPQPGQFNPGLQGTQTHVQNLFPTASARTARQGRKREKVAPQVDINMLSAEEREGLTWLRADHDQYRALLASRQPGAPAGQAHTGRVTTNSFSVSIPKSDGTEQGDAEYAQRFSASKTALNALRTAMPRAGRRIVTAVVDILTSGDVNKTFVDPVDGQNKAATPQRLQALHEVGLRIITDAIAIQRARVQTRRVQFPFKGIKAAIQLGPATQQFLAAILPSLGFGNFTEAAAGRVIRTIPNILWWMFLRSQNLQVPSNTSYFYPDTTGYINRLLDSTPWFLGKRPGSDARLQNTQGLTIRQIIQQRADARPLENYGATKKGDKSRTKGKKNPKYLLSGEWHVRDQIAWAGNLSTIIFNLDSTAVASDVYDSVPARRAIFQEYVQVRSTAIQQKAAQINPKNGRLAVKPADIVKLQQNLVNEVDWADANIDRLPPRRVAPQTS